jgi:hypothetical protein
MWRPGKLRFLIDVKNPLPIRSTTTARKRGPLQAPPVPRFATPVGLRLPVLTHPATLSHPDQRAFLIRFAAPHQLSDFTRPVVRAGAGFHRDDAPSLRC